MSWANELARSLADGLLSGSVQGALFIAVVWIVCHHIPRIPASIQAGLWWLASLKLVLAALPVPEISLPLLPAAASATDVLRVSESFTTPSAGGSVLSAEPDVGISWLGLVIAAWIIGILVLAIRLVIAFRDLRGIAARSMALSEEHVVNVQHVAGALGLKYVPPVRLSTEIDTPLVAGLWRPIVLVPAHAHLDSEELRMALCHELMHVRRRDLALGWVPAIAERLFFFHPLARLTAREYVTAREAACDAAVVRALGISPDHYGRLLVRFGFARSEPAFAAGGAPGSISSLRRRLDMLQHPASTRLARGLSWALVILAMLATVPFQLSAKAPLAQEASPRAAVQPTISQAQAPVREQIETREPRRPAGERAGAQGSKDADVREIFEEALRLRRQEPMATENFLRDQLAAMVAQFEALAQAERQARERNVEQETRLTLMKASEASREAYRKAVIDAEQGLEARRQADRQARDAGVEEKYRQALLDAERSVEASREAYRKALLDAEQGLKVQRQVEVRTREQSGEFLATQLEFLRKQQQELLQQLQVIAEQQKALADAQRQIATETERLREALKER